MAEVSFTVPGRPCTQGSKDQFGREANKRLPGWRSDARQAAAAAKPLTWDTGTPMAVTFDAFFPRPASHYGRRKGQPYLKPTAPAFPGRVADADKIARALCDALTAILWNDDDQVVILGPGRKLYADLGDQPRTEVRVAQVS